MRRPQNPNRAKLLRGLIMKLLYFAEQSEPINPDDPTLLSYDVLTLSLEHQGSRPGDDELNALMRYLEGKRYVDVQWLEDGSGRWDAVRVLPLGIDLVEQSVTDPGVTFSKRRA